MAVSDSPAQLQDPHVWHAHTSPFIVVGQGRWDYRFGVQSFEKFTANGNKTTACSIAQNTLTDWLDME